MKYYFVVIFLIFGGLNHAKEVEYDEYADYEDYYDGEYDYDEDYNNGQEEEESSGTGQDDEYELYEYQVSVLRPINVILLMSIRLGLQGLQ